MFITISFHLIHKFKSGTCMINFITIYVKKYVVFEVEKNLLGSYFFFAFLFIYLNKAKTHFSHMSKCEFQDMNKKLC